MIFPHSSGGGQSIPTCPLQIETPFWRCRSLARCSARTPMSCAKVSRRRRQLSLQTPAQKGLCPGHRPATMRPAILAFERLKPDWLAAGCSNAHETAPARPICGTYAQTGGHLPWERGLERIPFEWRTYMRTYIKTPANVQVNGHPPTDVLCVRRCSHCTSTTEIIWPKRDHAEECEMVFTFVINKPQVFPQN